LQKTNSQNLIRKNLIVAEKKASKLFDEIESKGLISSGKFEEDLNLEIYNLAYELYGIKKYWHKRIVRAGKNTLMPYKESPENILIKKDDILFIDFGPIFEEWEADFGRTYVLGNDLSKIKLKNDIESAWKECRDYYKLQDKITGKELFNYAVSLAEKYGWEFGGEIAGHIIGHFPHERLEKEDKTNYIHPKNNENMLKRNSNGIIREWILEIHFVNKKMEIGGFFEQLLT